EARIAAQAFVALDARDRDDLVREAAGVAGADRALVTLEGVTLHVLARDGPLLRDHLRAAELRHLSRAAARHPTLRASKWIRDPERLCTGHRIGNRDLAHVLDAAGDDPVARDGE